MEGQRGEDPIKIGYSHSASAIMPKSPSGRRTTPQAASKKARGSEQKASGATRSQVVWISFLGAMTAVGGLLLLVDGKPSPRADGLSLSPLAAATTIGNDASSDPVIQTRVAMDTSRWQAIVVHHTGSPVGSPVSIAKENESRGIRGLGHHFVIGNGSGMDDGQVHIGFRWLDQLAGAHAAGTEGDWYNHHAISICLVGDGERGAFSPAQVQQVQSLISSLRKRLDIPSDRVFLYSDIAPGSKDPGRLFPEHVVRLAN